MNQQRKLWEVQGVDSSSQFFFGEYVFDCVFAGKNNVLKVAKINFLRSRLPHNTITLPRGISWCWAHATTTVGLPNAIKNYQFGIIYTTHLLFFLGMIH